MNAAILIGVGQRFISRIHDGSILLHPFEEIVHDMVGALRDLKRKRASCSPGARPDVTIRATH